MDLSELSVDDLEQGIEVFTQALVDDQLEDGVKTIFEDFDEDENGSLDRAELFKFFTTMFEEFKVSMKVNNEFLDQIFAEYDTDQNKKIEPAEMKVYLKTFLTNIMDLCVKEKEKREA